jgi:phosphohistidine swiveling domain-containing protein
VLGAGRSASSHDSERIADEGRLLVEALKGGRLDPVSTPPTRQLVAAAEQHGVLLSLRRAYGGVAGDAQTAELTASARRLRALALRIATSGVEVSDRLQRASVPHVVVKGPAIAADYPDADREFIDLDVLVAPSYMTRAIGALEEIGAVVLEPEGWPRNDGIGELVLGLPSGVAIDLHADLVHHAELRRQFDFPAEPLIARATTARVLGHEIPVLDPEDSCTYVALHAAISGGHRLVWLADLDALVRQDRIQWDVLVARARQARLALVVGVMLDRAAAVLGTQVPPAALDSLSHRGWVWRRLVAGFESRRPTSASHGQLLRGQILVRATRDSTAASLRELARLVWTEVIWFVVRDSHHPWREQWRSRWRAQAPRWR